MYLQNKSASEIAGFRPPDKNDQGSFAVIWWASHCINFNNKGSWIFIKFGQWVWFSNPENKLQLIRVHETGDLQQITVSESLLVKFLNHECKW